MPKILASLVGDTGNFRDAVMSPLPRKLQIHETLVMVGGYIFTTGTKTTP